MVAMSRGVKIELRFRVNRTMLRTPDCQVVLIENLESLDWGLEAFIHSQPNATLTSNPGPYIRECHFEAPRIKNQQDTPGRRGVFSIRNCTPEP